MLRKSSVILLLTALAVAGSASPARADITAFLGVSPTPGNHSVKGFSGGLSLLVVGFEFEYAQITEDEFEGLPSLKTWSGNVFVQNPVEIAGTTFYGTAGAGGYSESLTSGSLVHEESHFGTNIGGGAKINLVGPIRVRLDYRVFRLQGSPLNSVYQRFYVGANLKF
jgi:opacity protein-like surface antigen